MNAQLTPALLVLQDGTVFRGTAVGKIGTTTGEICFNTGMTGYQEVFTDPSYFGQILVMTSDHIGNYGVHDEEIQSDGIKIAGLTLYGFMVLNNDLINAGYAITNENREEKYLQILETGDEKLISKLEDYLNYKDEIEKVAYLERKFSKFKNDVLSSSTVEDVIELTNKFLENFYLDY